MAQDEMGVYIFCGIQTDKDDTFENINVDGQERETYTIRYKDAAIVAATMPMKIYTPSKENLMMHESMVSQVMSKKEAVIPISFGNIFKSKEDVEVLLENLYPQFEKIFPEIKGKIELGLKVIGKQEWLESSVNDNKHIKELAKEVNGKSKEASYYDQIKLGEQTKNIFDSLSKELENDIYQPLSDISTASKLNELQGEKMLLNAAFLIDREKEDKFDRLVNNLYDKWQDKVEFKYTGPWAAYNFVNIRLNIEGS